MKSKFSNIKLFFLIGMAITGASMFMTSCLKDTGPVEDFSKSPAVVGFQFTGNGEEPINASLYGTASDSTDIEVTLSVASLTLSTPVTVTIAADTAAVAAYNVDSTQPTYPTVFTSLPSSQFTLENGGVLTINPGQQIVQFKVSFAGNLIDFAQNPALGLEIVSVSGGGAIVATNLNVAVLLLHLRNAYEGTYSGTGYFFHPSAPRALDLTASITTVTLITSNAPLGDLGGWTFNFDTNPTTYALSNWQAEGATYTQPQSGFFDTDDPSGFDYTSVTGGLQPGVAPWVQTTYNNTYDPVNHIFWMHYGYGNGAGGESGWLRNVYEEYALQ